MSERIDLNVDMGESFGRWQLGDDAAMMPFVSSVSIACGFHAGDPSTMRETVAHAVEHGVSIGAHVGLPDLWGFGRRRMAVSPQEVHDYCTFQIGALRGFVTAAGAELRHVKPHGALYAMCTGDPALAGAVAEAMSRVVPGLPLILLDASVADAVEAHGVRLVTEAFPDLDYQPDGTLVIERVKAARDPEQVAQRTLRLVREGVIEALDGSLLEVDAPTACIHGDGPNSVEIARTVRERLDANGIEVAPLHAAA
jgi:5-oxoprolinase (ATP-hydrolysing) subunit A